MWLTPYLPQDVDLLGAKYSSLLLAAQGNALCPSPTVPNLLQNEDECKKFEIRAHSSLSEGQMDKKKIFQLGMVKSTKIVRPLLRST